MAEDWRRGGRVKPLRDLVSRAMRQLSPAPAARSSNGSKKRVREMVALGESFLRELEMSPPHEAVDQLLEVAGFNDLALNERLRWSRLLASRLGMDAPRLVLELLADIVADNSAASVGGCLSYRLPKLLATKKNAP